MHGNQDLKYVFVSISKLSSRFKIRKYFTGMSDSSFLSLIAVGGAALFGLNGALGLTLKHHLFRNNYINSACNKIGSSKDEYTSIFSIACMAVIFYCMVLFIIFIGIYDDEINIFFLNTAMIVAMLATGYYTYKMFFKLRIICVGCIRVHLANLMMTSAMLFYNLQ